MNDLSLSGPSGPLGRDTTGNHSDLAPSRRAGFSLVEVVIAVGIIGFSFAVIAGLMATGLTTFRQSSNQMISAQISQTLLSELTSSDWTSLFNTTNSTNTGPLSLPIRYFSDSGEEVQTPSAAIYIAQPVLFSPAATAAPSTATSASLAGLDYASMGTARMARVVVQVMYLPGGVPLPVTTSGLWNPTQKDHLKSYSTILVRNN